MRGTRTNEWRTNVERNRERERERERERDTTGCSRSRHLARRKRKRLASARTAALYTRSSVGTLRLWMPSLLLVVSQPSPPPLCTILNNTFISYLPWPGSIKLRSRSKPPRDLDLELRIQFNEGERAHRVNSLSPWIIDYRWTLYEIYRRTVLAALIDSLPAQELVLTVEMIQFSFLSL